MILRQEKKFALIGIGGRISIRYLQEIKEANHLSNMFFVPIETAVCNLKRQGKQKRAFWQKVYCSTLRDDTEQVETFELE